MSDRRLAASFRDPSGFVFEESGELLRQVNAVYRGDYRRLMDSGLYRALVDAKLLIPHEEVSVAGRDAVAILRPERVPFISYPYEWSFGQLKDAALATLEAHRRALDYEMWLKDASAYNIQFHRGRPVLIDTLSFETHREGEPWPAYRQFCEHFLAPLVLMSGVDIRLGRLQREYIDGVPLDLAAHLAPGRTKLNPGLAIHLHAHAHAQTANAGKNVKASGGRIAKAALLGMIDSLRGVIQHLDWKPEGTVWADYYKETNYSEASFSEKKRVVGEMLDAIRPRPNVVWDLGANTGEFSALATERGMLTLAWDVDPGAVERNYRDRKNDPLMLPLLQDLTNPSPGVGWANRERDSFARRGPAGAVMALALVHHLAIGNNVPLGEVAKFFGTLSDWAIVEFVPKSDSQVQRLLATRADIYDGYTQAGFESSFEPTFEIVRSERVEGSERTLYLLRRRA